MAIPSVLVVAKIKIRTILIRIMSCIIVWAVNILNIAQTFVYQILTPICDILFEFLGTNHLKKYVDYELSLNLIIELKELKFLMHESNVRYAISNESNVKNTHDYIPSQKHPIELY